MDGEMGRQWPVGRNESSEQRSVTSSSTMDGTAKINACPSFVIIKRFLSVDLWSYHSYYLISDFLSQNYCVRVVITTYECSRLHTGFGTKSCKSTIDFEQSKWVLDWNQICVNIYMWIVLTAPTNVTDLRYVRDMLDCGK